MSVRLLEHSDSANMFSGKRKLTGNVMDWPYSSFVRADASAVAAPAPILSGAGTVFDPNCFYNTKYPTDESLSRALVGSYSGTALPGVSWPHDLGMMKWARAVMCYYDRDRPGPNDGSKWADRADLFFFDAAVKYFKKFNYQYQYKNADCYILKESNTAIDNERTNILQQRAANSFGTGEEGVYLQLLKDLQNNIDNTLAQLSCTEYIANTEQSQAEQSLQTQLQQATTLTSTDKTATYVVIGTIVLIVGVTGYFLLK